MKQFIGNKSIKDDNNSLLSYYIVSHNGRYGIQSELDGEKFTSTCVYNISDKECVTKDLAKYLLECDVSPIAMIDVLEDLT